MFDLLRDIGAAWHTIEFVSMWSGLSMGALAGLGALFYFFPLLRKIVIYQAVIVIVAWSCLMHGHIRGAADEDDRLKTISEQEDKRAAGYATANDKARAAEIEAKAKAQHETDLGEIASMGGNSCSFDPGIDELQPLAATGSRPVNSNAKPAAGTKKSSKASAGAAARQGMRLPMVFGRWLQGKEHGGNASPDGQR